MDISSSGIAAGAESSNRVGWEIYLYMEPLPNRSQSADSEG
ncbi:MAG: hypothetical protein QUS66_01630 [Bacteroidota bacterium]|nr:hypothetical protein [Bacteroidota bacterium]